MVYIPGIVVFRVDDKSWVWWRNRFNGWAPSKKAVSENTIQILDIQLLDSSEYLDFLCWVLDGKIHVISPYFLELDICLVFGCLKTFMVRYSDYDLNKRCLKFRLVIKIWILDIQHQTYCQITTYLNLIIKVLAKHIFTFIFDHSNGHLCSSIIYISH